MAGDWIKWAKGLSKKPEVVRMSVLLNASRREVAALCMELWEWCDENIPEESLTAGGSAFVTLSPHAGDNMDFIDAIVGTPRFAESLAHVGWVRFNDERIEFPNFGRHNGTTAKTRARNTNNQKDKRAKSSNVSSPAKSVCHQQPVTGVTETSPFAGDISVTREEKRRDIEERHTPREKSETNRHPLAESYPTADPAIACVEIDGELVSYDQDSLRWEAEFVRLWNNANGNSKHSGAALSQSHRNHLRNRLSDPGWFWKRAVAMFPLWSESGWKPGLTWFLEADSVQKILEGRYEQRKPTSKTGLFDGGHREDPTRVRTGRTVAALEAAMSKSVTTQGIPDGSN